MTTSRWPLRLLAPAAAVLVVLAGTTAARAQPPAQPDGWIRHNAVPLTTTDPAAPLGDLAPLRGAAGDAEIVGLGESVHGTAEQTALKHRTLRFLVERMGFRSIAWEDDWTIGLRIDEYVTTGRGDVAALVGDMSTAWRSHEVADLLRWLRRYNAGRADKVRFFGVEYFSTRPLAYDAVAAHVAAAAPDRLPELRRHLRVIRPYTSDMGAYVKWYTDVADKGPYIRHARQAYELVERLPHEPGDRAYAVTLHHARQIVSFYEHFDLPFAEALVYRDAHAARNLRWWREFTGSKIAYWAASPHTANAPGLRIAVPPGPDMRFPSAGSYLRRWYGRGYVSIGFTFDHGTVSTDPGQTVTLPPPAPDWFERPFGEVRAGQFLLDLRRPAPPPVRAWLAAPLRTRGLPDAGPGSSMSGGTLSQWFDVIVHRQEVSPVSPA